MSQHGYIYFFTVLFSILLQGNNSLSRRQLRPALAKRNISDEITLRKIFELTDSDDVLKRALDNILIPRVVGTSNHTSVIQFITKELQNLGWSVEHDTFTSSTPAGTKTFSNIIATPNQNAARYLDIACHFDSKLYNDIVFYGATDSAVPCAIMLQLAHSLSNMIKTRGNNDISLRYIFFDGEEAFNTWTDYDSLYGSRHLAHKWSNTPAKGAGRALGLGTELDRMEVLVLLDLLGSRNPRFYNFFADTQDWYNMLVNAERKLKKSGLLAKGPMYFKKMSTPHQVDDDHIPFLKRGVPILHIIPIPFPKEWHTADDNHDVIDYSTVRNLKQILGVFIVEFIGLV